jgi:hypothetical protein
MNAKTKLMFNPDCMTVKDLKKAAETLRGILQDYDRFASDDPKEATPADGARHWESVGCAVAQVRNAFDLDEEKTA